MKFLSEEMFHSNVLNKTLMISMMLSLLFFGLKWSLKRGILKSIFENNKLEEFEILEILFTSNFVGFIFLKSFHYQFYVWYFHSLPFLLEFVEMNNFMKVLLFGLLEYSWNVFPSTPTSSLILQAVHFILFVNLIFKIRK
jgi:alpha-1,3-mannosyltransferase